MCKYKDYDSRLQCTDKNVGGEESNLHHGNPEDQQILHGI